jgi:DNA repair exonuclease SbcCD nuclease subunit
VKILHTSDIHLQNFEDERWFSLEKILEVANKYKVDVVAIAGDLFDKNVNAEDLRPKLREKFSGNEFKIIILPGNHDKRAFKSGLFFGGNVVLLNDFSNSFHYKNVRFWGLPYEKLKPEEIYNKLYSVKEEFDNFDTNILLYHGELLDASFIRKDFGEEGDKRYMPVKLSYFNDFNINYILAGHFHKKFEVWKTKRNTYFVYSGSPISISKKETGKRKVNLFEIGETPTGVEIDTPYFKNIIIDFNPLVDLDPVSKLKAILDNLDTNAKPLVKISGYLDSEKIGKSEEEIANELIPLLEHYCLEYSCEFKNISHILEDYLFQKIIKKIDEKTEIPSHREKLMRLTIDSMRGLNL